MQAIILKDCDVYSYKSDLETDPFGMLSALVQTGNCPVLALPVLLNESITWQMYPDLKILNVLLLFQGSAGLTSDHMLVLR